MLVKKELMVNGKNAILSYDDKIFGKDANTLNYENCIEPKLHFVDSKITVGLLINGEENYSDSELKYIPDFYFEVVDFDEKEVEFGCSEAIYQTVSNEEELLQLITKMSCFINNRDDEKCPKGFIAGYCDEKTSDSCEYSALKVEGLCGAECLDCGDDVHAYNEKGYVCSCSTISFEDRH